MDGMKGEEGREGGGGDEWSQREDQAAGWVEITAGKEKTMKRPACFPFFYQSLTCCSSSFPGEGGGLILPSHPGGASVFSGGGFLLLQS